MADSRELQRRTGFDSDQIAHSRQQWHVHPMKRILIGEMELEIEKLRNSLEDCAADKLIEFQAHIRAYRNIIKNHIAK